METNSVAGERQRFPGESEEARGALLVEKGWTEKGQEKKNILSAEVVKSSGRGAQAVTEAKSPQVSCKSGSSRPVRSSGCQNQLERVLERAARVNARLAVHTPKKGT